MEDEAFEVDWRDDEDTEGRTIAGDDAAVSMTEVGVDNGSC